MLNVACQRSDLTYILGTHPGTSHLVTPTQKTKDVANLFTPPITMNYLCLPAHCKISKHKALFAKFLSLGRRQNNKFRHPSAKSRTEVFNLHAAWGSHNLLGKEVKRLHQVFSHRGTAATPGSSHLL